MINGLSKFKLILYLAAIFAAGGVSGWVVAAKTTKQRMLAPPAPQEFSKNFCGRVFDNLELTEDQKERVREIAERYEKEMFKLHAQHGRQIGNAVSNRNAQLISILTPDQRTKWEEMERIRRESRRDRDRDRGPRSDRDRDRYREKSPRDGATNDVSAKPLR